MVVPELFFEDLVDFLVVVLVPEVLAPDFFVLVVVWALVPVVVVAVSFVVVHAVTNAKPTTAVRVRRRDFFIDVGVLLLNDSYSAA